MTIVVFDTNALLLPFTDGTDLGDELERLIGPWDPLVPSSVIDELHGLSRGISHAGRAAKSALKLIADWPRAETEAAGDDGVLEVARSQAGAVVTNDKRMQRELSRVGVQVLSSRGRGRLELRQRFG